MGASGGAAGPDHLADALEAAAIEFQDAWLESTGWFAGEVDHVAVA